MEPHGIAHRARTPDQKREVIERLLAVWENHPDLRLLQLITNVYSDCYYVEDWDFIEALERFYMPIGGNDGREKETTAREETVD